MKILPEPIVFEWDKGNIDKNLKKHSITNKEAEEACINKPIFISDDSKHSAIEEKRFIIWGATNSKRKLAMIFTMRGDKIRIISARDMNRKERRAYEEKIKVNTKV